MEGMCNLFLTSIEFCKRIFKEKNYEQIIMPIFILKMLGALNKKRKTLPLTCV